MKTSHYFQHHQQLLQQLLQFCTVQLPFCDDRASEVDVEFITMLKELSEAEHPDNVFYENGQSVITRIVSFYPHITPEVNRDLFWYFGGECLHYMSDEELAHYQQIDEAMHDAGNNLH